MRRSIAIVVLLALSNNVVAQCLTISVEPPLQVHFKKDLSATVLLRITNCGDKNLIAYGLKGRALPLLLDDTVYCGDNVACGIVLNVFDENSHQIFPVGPMAHDSIDEKPMTKSKLMDQLSLSRARFLENTVVLSPKEQIVINMEIDLSRYPFEEGSYFIQLTYYTGRYITNYVDEKKCAR